MKLLARLLRKCAARIGQWRRRSGDTPLNTARSMALGLCTMVTQQSFSTLRSLPARGLIYFPFPNGGRSLTNQDLQLWSSGRQRWTTHGQPLMVFQVQCKVTTVSKMMIFATREAMANETALDITLPGCAFISSSGIWTG